MEKYLEKVFEPLGKIVFPVGRRWTDEREAFGALNYEVLYAARRNTKKGKMFWDMACQVFIETDAYASVSGCLVVW